MGEIEEKYKHEDKVEKKDKKEEKSEEADGKEDKSKEKKTKKDKGGKEKKNPEDMKDPAKLKQKLEKLDTKMQALVAKREEILKLLEEAEKGGADTST
ncbi:unnamed protein product [Lupinus luteus]|uniref:Uncharacterized protein n=1 Tax=Lupinus luteus TaxID=3873 RepID=A0AAV1W6H4_LUPLU